MSEENVDALPLTSIELLDAAVWREIDSDEAQPARAFLAALSRLVGRWLMVRSDGSDAPGMDVVTVLCKARGYIARHGYANGEVLRQSARSRQPGRGMEQSL
jgi:hypothetical protein